MQLTAFLIDAIVLFGMISLAIAPLAVQQFRSRR